jgi:hypothetical protein
LPRERVHLHLRGEALRHAEYTDGEMITTGAVLWFDRKGRFIRTIDRVSLSARKSVSMEWTCDGRGLLVFALVSALAVIAGELQELPFRRRGRSRILVPAPKARLRL